MSLSIERMISDIYSGMSSPSAGWARRDMALEKKKALDEESQRKMDLQAMMEEGNTKRNDSTNAGSLARQGLANTGQADVAKISGEYGLKGHELTANAHKESAQINADAHKYGSDKSLAGVKYSADKPAGSKDDPRALLFKAYNEPGANAEQITANYAKIFGNNQDNTTAEAPASRKLLLPSTTGADKNELQQKNVSTAAPGTVLPTSRGAESMEFRSGPDPLEEEKKRKKSERRMFFGTKFGQ